MDYLTVAKNSNFAKLWSAQILSQIAQNLLNFALIIRVFDLAQGTRFGNISVALLVLSFGIPSIFFAAIAGVYVDYWDRKKVLVIANAARAVLVLGYLIFEHNLIMVLILSFVISAATQFFAPAESASLQTLVGKEKILTANSLFVFTFYACFIIGYSASAPVIKLTGAQGPYIVTSVMFFMAALLSLWLPAMKAIKQSRASLSHITASARQELAASWRTILDNHNLFFSILQLTITQAILGVMLALAPALSLALLKVPLQDASHVLVIPAGIGMVAGVILVGQLAKRLQKINLISIGLIVAGFALMLLGLSGQLYRTVHGQALATTSTVALIVGILVLILGLMNAIISVGAQTLLQEHSTDETRGKIFGALNMMVNVAATAPILVAGILADLFSVTRVISVIGFGLIIFAGLQVIFLRTRSRSQLEKLGAAE